jgi:hypothetical protein
MASESNPEPSVAIQPGCRDNNGPITHTPHRMFSDADYRGTTKWIAPNCVCCFDVHTCCLAQFCPCWLCGKNEWRFERIHNGEDALDSSWKREYGYNPVCAACCVIIMATGIPGRKFISYYRLALGTFI